MRWTPSSRLPTPRGGGAARQEAGRCGQERNSRLDRSVQFFASFQVFESVRDGKKPGQRIARRIGSSEAAAANNDERRKCSALKTGMGTKKQMLIKKCVEAGT